MNPRPIALAAIAVGVFALLVHLDVAHLPSRELALDAAVWFAFGCALRLFWGRARARR